MVVFWDVNYKSSTLTLTNNNLTATSAGTTSWVRATRGVNSGKWYWEVKIDAVNTTLIGIIGGNVTAGLNILGHTDASMYYSTGTLYGNGKSNSAYGASYTTGDTIGIALDMDLGTITFYKNGVSQGVAYNNLLGKGTMFPCFSMGGNTGTSTVTANFGSSQLLYNIPSGYKAYADIYKNKILLLSDDKTYSVDELKTSGTDSIPKMTSDILPSGKVIYSSQAISGWQAFDDSNTSYWRSTGASNEFIGYEFTASKIIGSYSLLTNNASYLSNMPKDFELQGSNDGQSFVTIDTRIGITDWATGVVKNFKTNNTKKYKTYRILCKTTNGGTLFYIYEIQFFEATTIPTVKQMSKSSEQNFIAYGMDSISDFNSIFSNKNYILQDTVSEDVDGLWKTQLDRKPLSIKF